MTTPSTIFSLDLAGEIVERYQLSALSGLLASVRASACQGEISVAMVGRFKAGKSSFLNHFLGRNVLPVGVVPVTAVVTQIRYGPREEARVYHYDGRTYGVPIDGIAGYISEVENPENVKQAGFITVDLPELGRFRGLNFVDTPGLESALTHNTAATNDWLSNVGLALVAVSVDPPLSAHDIELLRSLYRYTPKVAVLLTKADLVSNGELAEVVAFVRTQLARNFPVVPRVFPYSIKPGFERFREAVDAELELETLQRVGEARVSILARKLDTLLQECSGYLALSLKASELQRADRQALSRQLLGEKEAIDELKSTVRLVVQNATTGTRPMAGNRLEAHQGDLESRLLAAFENEFPKWNKSLATMLSSFEAWLANALFEKLAAVSVSEHLALLAPLEQVRIQAQRALQQFRQRLSDGAERAFGVPLPTSEVEIPMVRPANPDIRIGRVFDRNWELLSPVLPVWMVRGVVRRHFARTICYLIYQNLYRLAAQWETSIAAALGSVEQDVRRRLDELLATVERLMVNSGEELAPQLRVDLERLETARRSLV